MAVGVMAAFRSAAARQDAETLHCIDSGLIIVRVASFRRPLVTFHQQLSSTQRHRVGKAKTQCGFPQSTISLLHVRVSWLPVDFTDGGGTTVPLSGGLVGFVALRCYAEECAFSLSTQAQDPALDLAEYKRVKPAHCPTGGTSGGTGSERFFCGNTILTVQLCARALSFA